MRQFSMPRMADGQNGNAFLPWPRACYNSRGHERKRVDPESADRSLALGAILKLKTR